MGEYSVYVFSAYGIALGILFMNVVLSVLKMRTLAKNNNENAS